MRTGLVMPMSSSSSAATSPSDRSRAFETCSPEADAPETGSPAATITIAVKLFAAYQEAIGLPELVWTVPAGSTVATVRDRLLSEHPELEQWRKVTRFGVNLAFVPPETPLQDGDEVVPIPPVSGG